MHASSLRIGYCVARNVFYSTPRTGLSARRSPRAAVISMGKKKSTGGNPPPKQPTYQFNSDGTRVLDRGVWKEFKTCVQCHRIFVHRKSFEKNWNEVKFSSQACRTRSKSRRTVQAEE